MEPRCAKMVPRWSQDAPKMEPRSSQDGGKSSWRYWWRVAWACLLKYRNQICIFITKLSLHFQYIDMPRREYIFERLQKSILTKGILILPILIVHSSYLAALSSPWVYICITQVSSVLSVNQGFCSSFCSLSKSLMPDKVFFLFHYANIVKRFKLHMPVKFYVLPASRSCPKFTFASAARAAIEMRTRMPVPNLLHRARTILAK